MKERNIDAFYVRDVTDIAYLSSFERVFDSENAHALLVCDKGVFLHTDSRYELACVDAAQNDIVVSAEPISHAAWLQNTIREIFEGKGIVIGVEDTWSVREKNSFLETFKDSLASGKVVLSEECDFAVGVRLIKTPYEIDCLKSAQAITDAAFDYIKSIVKVGMSERELAVLLDRHMIDIGADDVAFATIVAAGEHAASPHAIPSDKRIEANTPVLVDFGAKKNGYCSDMTRVFSIGKPSDEVMTAWDAVVCANEAVEAALCCDVSGVQMHELALSVLKEHGFEGCMGHGLGHGVGMQIHEQPCLNPRNRSLLLCGSVVTVEPGIYLPGKFGLRLEDFGVVTQEGFEVFTRQNHNLAII
ncbi:MAG: M24 family metallopeptidase [Eggerthellaceae bacterium]|nr:M24 family metallopeptidase [Eggerthellaceae bacterium]